MDNNMGQGVHHHDSLAADPVDALAHQRGREEAADGERRDHDDHGVRPVEHHRHIRTEGEERLLPRAAEHLRYVLLDVLSSERKAPLMRAALIGPHNSI